MKLGIRQVMRHFGKPIVVALGLFALTLLGTVLAMVQVVQIPLGMLPADDQRLQAAPVWHFVHVLGGSAFGLLGPVQFSRALEFKFGFMHRLLGRVFGASGAMISLSALGLLRRFPVAYSPAISGARLVFGVALGAALIAAMRAVWQRDYTRHRNWMIRAYAIGIGTTVVSMVFFPIYLITGAPPQGLVADVAFVGTWTACILFAELLVRRI